MRPRAIMSVVGVGIILVPCALIVTSPGCRAAIHTARRLEAGMDLAAITEVADSAGLPFTLHSFRCSPYYAAGFATAGRDAAGYFLQWGGENRRLRTASELSQALREPRQMKLQCAGQAELWWLATLGDWAVPLHFRSDGRLKDAAGVTWVFDE
jgi:hypothetical protein